MSGFGTLVTLFRFFMSGSFFSYWLVYFFFKSWLYCNKNLKYIIRFKIQRSKETVVCLFAIKKSNISWTISISYNNMIDSIVYRKLMIPIHRNWCEFGRQINDHVTCSESLISFSDVWICSFSDFDDSAFHMNLHFWIMIDWLFCNL